MNAKEIAERIVSAYELGRKHAERDAAAEAADRDDRTDRAGVGNACVELAWGGPVADEDRETAARDAIANILTATVGIAGVYDGRTRVNRLPEQDAARRLVEDGFESWLGDAEDYTDRDDWPVHRPAAPEAPIPGRHWYSGCNPDMPRVNPETGVCEDCGATACRVCGREDCPDHEGGA